MPKIPNENEMKAKQLFRFYFRRLAEASGANWDPDMAGDIDSIIPTILDALDERIEQAVAKAMVGPMPGFVRTRVEIFNIDRLNSAAMINGSLFLNYQGSENDHELEGPEAEILWEILKAASVSITLERKPE